jgi:hypothetical protein
LPHVRSDGVRIVGETILEIGIDRQVGRGDQAAEVVQDIVEAEVTTFLPADQAAPALVDAIAGKPSAASRTALPASQALGRMKKPCSCKARNVAVLSPMLDIVGISSVSAARLITSQSVPATWRRLSVPVGQRDRRDVSGEVCGDNPVALGQRLFLCQRGASPGLALEAQIDAATGAGAQGLYGGSEAAIQHLQPGRCAQIQIPVGDMCLGGSLPGVCLERQ